MKIIQGRREMSSKKNYLIFLFSSLIFLTAVFLLSFFFFNLDYVGQASSARNKKQISNLGDRKVFHIKTPEEVRAIYMTSFVAGSEKLRKPIVDFIEDSEINSLVIDVKDYTGMVSFAIQNPKLKEYGSEEVRISDIKDFLMSLHDKNIYTIARVAVFQDPYFVKMRPDLAVKNKSGDLVWKDRKGISWIDAGAKDYWDYITLLGKEAYAIGFDEINFDYIRFPSDGDMKDISFPFSGDLSKSEVLKNFWQYLHQSLSTLGIKISADLFGMTTSAKGDMGIGQVLENALPYFDYIAPMIYPSHYPKGFEGYENPAKYPYEIISKAMRDGIVKAENASSTKDKFRPWIQDFDLGADYGENEVKAQIRALNELGINSYMVWSPSNIYTKTAFKK